MLHPSISRGSTVLNGIYPNQFGTGNAQLPTTPFQVFQKDKLTLAFTESFALRAYFSGTAQSIKALVNDVPVTDLSVIDKHDSHIAANAGVISYDGNGYTDITIGANGKPLLDGVVFAITDFLSVLGKQPYIVLSIHQLGGLYMFVPTASNEVVLYNWVNGNWAGLQSYAMGRAFLATDVIGFRVTPAKIELLINGVSQWGKARSWTVTLSSADLGTLATTPESPYTFGQSVDLTTGTTAGTFTLSVQNQEGVAFKIDQPIEVLTQTAPVAAPVVTTEELIIPLLAASMTGNLNATPVQSAESTDWGKILTWGGVALAGLLLLVGVVWAVRSK